MLYFGKQFQKEIVLKKISTSITIMSIGLEAKWSDSTYN